MTVYSQISLDRSDPFGYVFRFSGELRGWGDLDFRFRHDCWWGDGVRRGGSGHARDG